MSGFDFGFLGSVLDWFSEGMSRTKVLIVGQMYQEEHCIQEEHYILFYQ